MDFIERVLRYLFWLLVLSWSVWLLKKALGWMVKKAMGPAPESGYGNENAAGNAQDGLTARKLVRDPVCGVYVAEVLAIPLRDGGELLHFCSADCRDKYAAKLQRVAANG
jgi:hypothetical protein